MKVVVAAFNQEKAALEGAFSVIMNLRMELFEPVRHTLPHCNNNYRSSISLLFLLGLRTTFIDDKFCDNGTWTVKLATCGGCK